MLILMAASSIVSYQILFSVALLNISPNNSHLWVPHSSDLLTAYLPVLPGPDRIILGLNIWSVALPIHWGMKQIFMHFINYFLNNLAMGDKGNISQCYLTIASMPIFYLLHFGCCIRSIKFLSDHLLLKLLLIRY